MYSDGGFTTTSFTHTNKNYIYNKTTIILNCVSTPTDDFNSSVHMCNSKKVPLGTIYTETWNVKIGPYITAKLISNALQCFDQFHNIATTITTENNGHNLEYRGMEESTIMVIYQHQIEQYHKRCPPTHHTSTTDVKNQENVNSIQQFNMTQGLVFKRGKKIFPDPKINFKFTLTTH